MEERVCFYSKDDLSVGYYLEIAEKRIKEFQRKRLGDYVFYL